MDQKTVKRLKENKAIRILVYPIEQIRRRRRLNRYQSSEDAAYIRSLKGTHEGESCFVIGNGPSLQAEDLDTLAKAGVFCFAANRIYKIYPRTVWRPSLYMALDTYVLWDDFENIRKTGKYPKILNYNSARLGRRPEENIHYLCVHEPFQIKNYYLSSDMLSEDPSRYSQKTATVTVNSIELAIYMGFKRVYLLGVDNNYAQKRQADGTITTDPAASSYFPGGEPSKTLGVSVQPVDYMNESYKVAKKFADKHAVKILNATRGGKLEVFERVDFDDLMGQKEVV